MYDTAQLAHSSPYFKRNHMGRVTCTLCGVACNDENNFIKHLSGKAHGSQLERAEQREARRQRLDEEERRNAEAERRAAQEEAARALVGGGGAASPSSLAAAAVESRFGLPPYTFRTEHDAVLFRTKVWVDVVVPQAEDGTRPLHRWVSAREQTQEAPADDYYVYLLVACEGYATLCLKFPATAHRATEGDVGEDGGGCAARWDPAAKVYSLFVTFSR